MIKRLAQASSPVKQVQDKLREHSEALGDAFGDARDAIGDALSQIEAPQKGWKGICWRVFRKIDDARLSLVAAGVTFYVILALFPALTALVSIFGLLANPVVIGEQLVALSDVLPPQTIGLLRAQLDSILAAPSSSLGLGFVLSLLAAFWSINNAMKAMIDGLNQTYGAKETRNFVRLNTLSFSFAIGAVMMVVVYLIAIAVVPLVLAFVGLDEFTGNLIKMTRWPVLMVVSAMAISMLTRYGPDRVKPQKNWVTPGGVFVVLAWVAMSVAFSTYLSNFANYDKTYGSLGAAIGLMMWVWLSTLILLVGASVNAEMEDLPMRRKRKKALK